MKKLTITLQLELTVPDDWAVVDTSEGTPVLKLPDGRYLDIAVEPLFATGPHRRRGRSRRVLRPD